MMSTHRYSLPTDLFQALPMDRESRDPYCGHENAMGTVERLGLPPCDGRAFALLGRG
jgi:hypothetical protein